MSVTLHHIWIPRTPAGADCGWLASRTEEEAWSALLQAAAYMAIRRQEWLNRTRLHSEPMECFAGRSRCTPQREANEHPAQEDQDVTTRAQIDVLRQAANDPRAWWDGAEEHRLFDMLDDHKRNSRSPSWAWVWFWGAVAWLVCGGAALKSSTRNLRSPDSLVLNRSMSIDVSNATINHPCSS